VPFSQYRGGAMTWIRMYREQPWVKACVDKLTYQVARLPLGVFTGDPENPEQVHEGPLYDLIRRPAERCGPINLKQWMIKPALIHGKSPLQIVRRGAGGRPIGLRRLYPQWLSPRSLSGIPEDVDYWLYTRPNQPRRRSSCRSDLLLIAWDSENATFGTSPMRPLLMTLEIEAAARYYQQQLLRNGVRPPGGISWSDANPEVIALAENKEFRRMFEEEMTNALAGAHNAGKPVFMPPGAKWMSFAYSASDAELIAQRHLTREEVAAVYDIKPPELGVIDKSVGPAVPTLLPSLFTTTLPPWLELMCDCVGAQVIDPSPRCAASGSCSTSARPSRATRRRTRRRARPTS
jgi:HK97 family phage portal protein